MSRETGPGVSDSLGTLEAALLTDCVADIPADVCGRMEAFRRHQRCRVNPGEERGNAAGRPDAGDLLYQTPGRAGGHRTISGAVPAGEGLVEPAVAIKGSVAGSCL